MTQNERILRHMTDIGAIDPMTAMSEYGCMRLASRISDLKHEGYRIHTEFVKHTNRYGEMTHYAKYSLIE